MFLSKKTSLRLAIACLGLVTMSTFPEHSQCATGPKDGEEIQVTNRPVGHILTNTNVWSEDSKWIVYDTRSDPAGEKFDGSTIEIVNVATGEVRTVYQSRNGANCGVATFHPRANKVVFILGPERPTADWAYGPFHRQGVIVDLQLPDEARPLDARDLVPPFTLGALRGGTHVHVYSDDGQWVGFTYEDHVLAMLDAADHPVYHERNQRNVGVSVPEKPVSVPKTHPHNHEGNYFSVLVTRTVDDPRPGSDEIAHACEEGWVGSHGYRRADGAWQRRALAFQGQVITSAGDPMREVFIVDIPDDVTQTGDGPLAGTATTRPRPPRGTQQRRLTYTADRKYPGIQGPRHWVRSSPDGERIAFLMRDENGIVQIWSISPRGGKPQPLTHNAFNVASAFSWSPDGRSIAYVADNSVFVTGVATGAARRLTPRIADGTAPRPEACVFSPDGSRIAYVRPTISDGDTHNQIFIVSQ